MDLWDMGISYSPTGGFVGYPGSTVRQLSMWDIGNTNKVRIVGYYYWPNNKNVNKYCERPIKK